MALTLAARLLTDGIDDVREFEATRGLSAGETRPSRSRGSAAKKNVIHSDTSDNDDDDDEPKEKVWLRTSGGADVAVCSGCCDGLFRW